MTTMADNITEANDDAAKKLPPSTLPKSPAVPDSGSPQEPVPIVIDPILPIGPTSLPTSMEETMGKILGDVKLPERHPAVPQAEVPQKKYDTTLADPQRPVPYTEVARGIPEKTASQGTDTTAAPPLDTIRSLHTLKDDLQHVVQDNKMSYVRAVALEEEKRQRFEERVPPRAHKRSLLTVFILILLVGTGLLALGAVYIVMQQRTVQSDASQQSAILFAEQTVPFPVTNEASGDVRRTLASARNADSLTLGAILQIVPVATVTDQSGATSATPISFGEFLKSLGTRAPDELSRALGDEFFFGIHAVDENAPIIIVPVASYERAFAAMLAWEPFMNADLEPLFTPLSRQAMSPSGLPIERVFKDTVMRNYDVRVLEDDTGTVQLYYSFPTRNVLIIAESPFSFNEILSRLRADRRL
ncbi:MAG: hypothetical protein WAZ27_04280 [Minisyncoccia bacterium]